MNPLDPKTLQLLLDRMDENWSKDCWLLESQALSELSGLFTEDEVRTGVRELRKLYPTDTVAEGVRNGTLPRQVHGLILKGFYWEIWPLLLLGLDLDAIGPTWSRDKALVADLRQVKTFYERRVEIGVRAGLCRLGLTPVRVRETKKRRTCDLSVEVDGTSFELEIKAIGEGQFNWRLDALQSKLSESFFFGDASDGLRSPDRLKGMAVELMVGREYLDRTRRPQEVRDAFAQMTAAVPSASRLVFEHLADQRPLPAEIPVKGLGTVVLRADGPSDGWSVGISNLEPAKPRTQLKRLLKRIGQHASQLSGDATGVLALFLPHSMPAKPVAAALTRRLEHENSADLRHVDALLIVNHYRAPKTGELVFDHAEALPKWTRLENGLPERLKAGICNWQYTR